MAHDHTNGTGPRALRRRAQPRRWDGRGLLPLGALGFLVVVTLAWFPTQAIERTVHRDVQSRLDAGGHDWVSVSVSGQRVTLSGQPPTEAAADHVVELARGTHSATWAGFVPSTTLVQASFEPPTQPVRPGWAFRRHAHTFWLAGRVPSVTARNVLLDRAYALAAAAVPPHDVRSTLQIHAAAPPVSSATRALGMLEHCVDGRASLVDGQLSLVCAVASPDDETVLTSKLERLATQLPIEHTEVFVAGVADACDAAFDALLATPIQFVSGAPEIRPQSTHKLYALARAARQCPGRLRIEGHSDNSTNPTLAVRLSQLRAEAVKASLVKRGIPSDRLIAAGLGPYNPVASNVTREGRAANRRIEVRVVRPHDRWESERQP